MSFVITPLRSRTEDELLQPGEHKPFHGTREEWANQIVQVLSHQLGEIGISMQGDRQLRIAVVPLPASKLGQCRPESKSPIGDIRTQDEAASLLNVGKRSVERARQVLDHGEPELVQAACRA